MTWPNDGLIGPTLGGFAVAVFRRAAMGGAQSLLDQCRGAESNDPTRRCSDQEPADSPRDNSNVIGGWHPSLTFALSVVDTRALFSSYYQFYEKAAKADCDPNKKQ